MRCIENYSDFCDAIADIYPTLTSVLLHIMHIPVIILILLTLIGKENEDAKWFVLHTAILNLIVGIIWELIKLYPEFTENEFVCDILMGYAQHLSFISIFPLAFTRFFYLYFQDSYEKLFTRKTLGIWIIGYDLLFVLLTHFGIDSMIPIIFSIILIGTFIFTFLIYLKLHQMMKIVGNNSFLNTLSDLRRAAFICIFQSCNITLLLTTVFYSYTYLLFANYSDLYYNKGHILYILYQLSPLLSGPLYQLFVIVDTCIVLIALRSYRNAIKRFFRLIYNLFKRLFIRKKTTVQVISIM